MFPLRFMHQIEITSRCNLRCRYCVHPKMPRDKMDMDLPTYERALSLAAACVRKNGQNQVNLAGIGESTMHPDFVDWVHKARAAVGPNCAVVVTTNGLLITDEMARELAPARPAFFVSLHRPEKAGLAIEILKKHGILAGVSADPSVAAVDWAGQVEWFVSAPTDRKCPWVTEGRAFCMADGRLSACCFDGTGAGVFGTVFDDWESMGTAPYNLCKSCHLNVGVSGYERAKERPQA